MKLIKIIALQCLLINLSAMTNNIPSLVNLSIKPTLQKYISLKPEQRKQFLDQLPKELAKKVLGHTVNGFDVGLKVHDKQINDLSFSPDGSLLASCCDNYIKVLLLETSCKKENTVETVIKNLQTSNVLTAKFISNQHLISITKNDSKIKISNLTSNTSTALTEHTHPISCIAASNNGYLVSADEDKQLKTWKLTDDYNYKCIDTTKTISHIKKLKYSYNSKNLAILSVAGAVYVYDGKEIGNFSNLIVNPLELAAKITSLSLSHCSNYLAIGSKDIIIHKFSDEEWNCIKIIKAHTHKIKLLEFHPNPRFLVSCSDSYVKIWDLETDCKDSIKDFYSFNSFTAIAFSPDGRYLALGEYSGEIRLIDFWSLIFSLRKKSE